MVRRENTFKKALLKAIGTRWHVQSHEDRYSEGIPDLSFGIECVNGWIELKQIEKWPINPETPAKPEKYTPEQVNWLKRRGKKGGHCFVFIKVEKSEYFLFDWSSAPDIRAGMKQATYNKTCVAKWSGKINVEELLDILVIHP